MQNITRVAHWASSANGMNIELYANAPIAQLENLAPILFIGGVHGDEPEGVRLAQDWLNWLRNNYQSDKHHAWVLISCINPDGFALNERVNGNGVDLNRNYPSKCWQPSYDNKRYYPGDYSGSEPEIAALVSLISQVSPRLIVHFHSWQPAIVYTNAKALTAALVLADSSGYPVQEDIGYPTPGSLGEYAGNDLDIGVICIEEQEGMALTEVFPRFKDGLITLLSK